MVNAAKKPIGKIVRSVDFQRILATRSCVQSSHFAVHYLSGRPSTPNRRIPMPVSAKLSTSDAVMVIADVDNSSSSTEDGKAWLGTVVPKRHAKRSVTRSMLKRQMRDAFREQQNSRQPLLPGLWLVRLRSAFDPAEFVSANSPPLQNLAAAEVRAVLAQATQRRQPAALGDGSAKPKHSHV